MVDEITQLVKDAQEHEDTYHGVMKTSAEFGVPFALGLAVMFTSMTMANGVLPSILFGIITYIFVFIVVKMFFSH